MRIVVTALMASSVVAGVAHAADKPAIGPAPSWVVPVAIPSDAGATADAPVSVLLSDQQVKLERGRQVVYVEMALRIQTPEGLSAGNISYPWRPDVDELTVHKLHIRRGDKVIDVLASGQTFTVVRREQNLESAMLDGVLTANIQPEGLQVGDILDFAASVSSNDPTLKGHVEQFGAGGFNGVPIKRAHLRVQWPAALPVRMRQTAALPPTKLKVSGGTTAFETTLADVALSSPPKGAPTRYRLGRLVEFTDFASWADLGALMAPLYAQAATIAAQGPLRSEFDRIASMSSDPKVRAQAALALVQDRIRYVALTMGAGGYVPADAETTWARRYGDCKAKTALLLGLLHGLGIEAVPVVVNSMAGDGIDARLPMAGLFDHVLVRATIAGRVYWLDGTRTRDTDLDRISVPDVGWGLPLVERGAALVRMLPAVPPQPMRDTTIRIDASAGISAPAPTTVETVLRGDEAIGTGIALASLGGEARDRALKEYWKGQYDFIEVATTAATFDATTGEERLSMTGKATLDWSNGNYQTDGTSVGYRADFSRDPGRDQDAPFAVAFPWYIRTRETIVLPKGAGTFRLGAGIEVNEVAGGIDYRRHASIADNIFSVEKTERSVTTEFPAADAAKEQAALRALADRSATLRTPVNYSYTGKDTEALRATVPTTSAGYVSRAKAFIDRDLRADALRDYDKAIALDPDNVYAWANRGMTRVQVGDLAGAKADLAKADSIDPDFILTAIARGMLARRERRWGDAVKAYTRALALEPDNGFAAEQRATSYAMMGDQQSALTALTEWVTRKPDDATRYVTRGNAYMNAARYDEAIADFDRAQKLEPDNVWAVANRGMARLWKSDAAGATKDLDAAAVIDPRNVVVLRARGLLTLQKGDAQAAVDAFTQALAVEPDNAFALGHRAEAQHALRHEDAALQDAAAAIRQSPIWTDMYLLRANILRGQGKFDAALAEAAALTAANPNDAYAQVVAARLLDAAHRLEEARAAYDRALAIKPEAYIYYNRSLSHPKADIAARRADLDAALKLDPTLVVALAGKAQLLADGGDLPGAIAQYTAALATVPEDDGLLTARGIAYARAGDRVRADADFARAREKAAQPMQLNNMCWAKATAGVALESALQDCDAALAKLPDAPAILDSRGFVLLRLGRADEAIAVYDRVLAEVPTMAVSRYARALAWARKGDTTKAAADAAAAEKADPDVRARYAEYGMQL